MNSVIIHVAKVAIAAQPNVSGRQISQAIAYTATIPNAAGWLVHPPIPVKKWRIGVIIIQKASQLTTGSPADSRFSEPISRAPRDGNLSVVAVSMRSEFAIRPGARRLGLMPLGA
jgi:hypothetical protein